MIIDEVQGPKTQSQNPQVPTHSYFQESPGERSPLMPSVDNDHRHDINASQSPPPYAPASSSRPHNATNNPYFNPGAGTGPNPTPQPVKRFIRAFLVAYVCCLLWVIFVETFGVMVIIDLGSKRHEGQKLTSAERYTSMGSGGRGRNYFSLLNDSWPTATALTSSPHPSTRSLPIRYPPSFSIVSPPPSHGAETPTK